MSSVDSGRHRGASSSTVGGSEAFFFRYLFIIDKNSGHF
jgi:hypothetical protein